MQMLLLKNINLVIFFVRIELNLFNRFNFGNSQNKCLKRFKHFLLTQNIHFTFYRWFIILCTHTFKRIKKKLQLDGLQASFGGTISKKQSTKLHKSSRSTETSKMEHSKLHQRIKLKKVTFNDLLPKFHLRTTFVQVFYDILIR